MNTKFLPSRTLVQPLAAWRLHTTRAGVLLLAVVLLLGGCERLPYGFTPIADVVRAPGEFEGKTVKVRGRVTDAVALPVAGMRYYTLQDDGDELVVFAASGVPAVGAQVTVVGTVSSPAIIVGVGIGLHLSEQKRW